MVFIPISPQPPLVCIFSLSNSPNLIPFFINHTARRFRVIRHTYLYKINYSYIIRGHSLAHIKLPSSIPPPRVSTKVVVVLLIYIQRLCRPTDCVTVQINVKMSNLVKIDVYLLYLII